MAYQQYYHTDQYLASQQPSHAVNVYFDLETTGFSTPAITQIAAVGPPSMGNFNRYVFPTKPIEPKASEITGLTCHDGRMYKFGEQVDAVPISKALIDLINFIGNQRVVLVGHNAHRFDGPILHRVAESEGLLGHLQSRVAGVTDTLKIFKEINPYDSNKLMSLVERYLGRSGQTHDALDDAHDLKMVVMRAQPPQELQMKYTKPL